MQTTQEIVITSFSAEVQRTALETKWNSDVPLDLEEVEIQAIVDTEVQWLEDCDNMLLRMTGSNFVEIEDDFSVGSFNSSASKVSFDKVPNVFAYDKNKYRYKYTFQLGNIDLGKAGVDNELDDEACLDSRFKKNQ